MRQGSSKVAAWLAVQAYSKKSFSISGMRHVWSGQVKEDVTDSDVRSSDGSDVGVMYSRILTIFRYFMLSPTGLCRSSISIAGFG